jgi:predicted lipoprotein with Yx(FWY)xxD motif
MVNMNVAARGIGSVLGGLAAMLFVACGSNAAAPQGGTVTTKDVAGVGSVLADQAGKTLYFTDSEQEGIRCTGECIAVWLPAMTAPDDKVDGLGTVKRPDNGEEQLTYRGRPLYTFSMDETQRTASGNNAKDSFGGSDFTWHAAVVRDSPAKSTPKDDGGYGGGGY